MTTDVSDYGRLGLRKFSQQRVSDCTSARGFIGVLVSREQSAVSMRRGTRLAAGKLTLLARSSTTSRTTDSEYSGRARVILLHSGNWELSTTALNRRYASAHRIQAKIIGPSAFVLQKSDDFPLIASTLFLRSLLNSRNESRCNKAHRKGFYIPTSRSIISGLNRLRGKRDAKRRVD
jgi:hypothetical protein